jgi:hypothetical protein
MDKAERKKLKVEKNKKKLHFTILGKKKKNEAENAEEEEPAEEVEEKDLKKQKRMAQYGIRK